MFTDFKNTVGTERPTMEMVPPFEPVMYLGPDSYSLVNAAPRVKAARHLDLCTGSGVQVTSLRRV